MTIVGYGLVFAEILRKLGGMNVSSRGIFVAAGVAGLTGVALGAFGAHALKEVLAKAGMTEVWRTATHYHVAHAVALLALAAAPQSLPTRAVARWWVAGLVLFCGSLYGLALGGPRWLGPVTPLGGVAFMVGWSWLAWRAWRGCALTDKE